MSKTSVAASSTSIVTHATTLALALVVALEASGVYALSQGPVSLEAVAADEGAALQAPAQRHAASVEISIVAQADMPAR